MFYLRGFSGEEQVLCSASHFWSTFLQPVNNSKNSILNWFMKLNLCMFFFFFVFETILKNYPFVSPILPTLCFRYLQTCIKESCRYLSSQRFFKIPHKLRNSKKNPRKIHFSLICRPKLQIFPSVFTIGLPHEANELSKQSRNWMFVENGCRQKCLDKNLSASQVF